jgi:hypothetical protein
MLYDADHGSSLETVLGATTRVTTGSEDVSMMWSTYRDTGYQLLRLRQHSLSIVRDSATPSMSSGQRLTKLQTLWLKPPLWGSMMS